MCHYQVMLLSGCLHHWPVESQSLVTWTGSGSEDERIYRTIPVYTMVALYQGPLLISVAVNDQVWKKHLIARRLSPFKQRFRVIPAEGEPE